MVHLQNALLVCVSDLSWNLLRLFAEGLMSALETRMLTCQLVFERVSVCVGAIPVSAGRSYLSEDAV